MGEVFRARDTRLNRDVAIKVLPTAFAQDSRRVARFRREAQLLASLNHPNIAAIHILYSFAARILVVSCSRSVIERTCADRTVLTDPVCMDPPESGARAGPRPQRCLRLLRALRGVESRLGALEIGLGALHVVSGAELLHPLFRPFLRGLGALQVDVLGELGRLDQDGDLGGQDVGEAPCRTVGFLYIASSSYMSLTLKHVCDIVQPARQFS
jgi:hypothetical protein